MTTVERPHVVNHVPLRSSSRQPSVQQPVAQAEADLVGAALKSEEEQIIQDDEEITSVEDNDDHMLNFAIAKSVEDSGILDTELGDGDGTDAVAHRSDQKSLLGKRQRPDDNSVKQTDSYPKGLSKVSRGAPVKTEVDSGHSDSSSVLNQSQDAQAKASEPPGIERTVGVRVKNEDSTGEAPNDGASHTNQLHVVSHGVATPSVRIKTEQEAPGGRGFAFGTVDASAPQQRLVTTRLTSGVIVPLAKTPQSVTSTRLVRPTAATVIPISSMATRTASQGVGQTSVMPPPTFSQNKLALTSGAVPNPLMQTIPTSILSGSAPKTLAPTSRPASTSVPCPLSSVPCPLPSPSSVVSHSVAVTPTTSATMPPPVPVKVEQKEQAPQQPRERAFSVDLDPSMFDFSGMGMDPVGPDRAGSSYAGPGDSGAASSAERDRSFSFEFFNFASEEMLNSSSELSLSAAYNPDGPFAAPVPSSVESNGVVRRPRGDSIIFDPISFQDGGIHETNALAKVCTDGSPAPPSNLKPGVSKIDTALKASNVPGAVSNGVTAFTVSAASSAAQKPHVGRVMTASIAAAASDGMSSTNSLQMELLNKDGRIGIYLPEERKARIARFHSKRKMRIWRKRIKYDCRKKLADSRPRIKGRFVKRSDVDEE